VIKKSVHRSNILLRLYVFLIVFSLAGHALAEWRRLDPGPVAPIAASATLICSLVFLFSETFNEGAAVWLPPIAIWLVGLLCELIGLRTGWPFGPYRYTGEWKPSVLVPTIGPFPVLLPFAWVLVVCASTFSVQTLSRRTLVCIAAATLATTLDLVMEGVLAGKLQYWKWGSSGPLPGNSPLSNSISWFALSLFGALLLTAKKVSAATDAESFRRFVWNARVVYVGQLLLMLGLALA
jgi:uncharacterized membrane protein